MTNTASEMTTFMTQPRTLRSMTQSQSLNHHASLGLLGPLTLMPANEMQMVSYYRAQIINMAWAVK